METVKPQIGLETATPDKTQHFTNFASDVAYQELKVFRFVVLRPTTIVICWNYSKDNLRSRFKSFVKTFTFLLFHIVGPRCPLTRNFFGAHSLKLLD